MYNWYDKRALIKRQFTYMADRDTEVLILSVEHLNQMQMEFTNFYDSLFEKSNKRLKKAWKYKLESMKFCGEIMAERSK